MAKFKDPDTGEIIELQQYLTSVRGEELIYKGKNGKQLINTEGKPLELIKEEKEYDIDNMPSFLTFAGKSNEDKKKILGKRAHNHFKKEIHERKMNMDGHTGKQS